MILVWLVGLPLAAGLVAWAVSRVSDLGARLICLAAMVVETVLAVYLWAAHGPATVLHSGGPWIANIQRPWIPQFGASFHLSMDGLSLLMVVLTAFLGIVSVVVSWTGIRERVGFFHLNLMFTLSGVVGVFLSMDLFLLYFFWELMLVPMYFLIDIWGHERRHYAAVKFFIFTQLSGLLMFLAILGLYFVHGSATGHYTFDYFALLRTPMAPAVAFWLMLGFFVAFAVKLPAVPVHTWLPDAHTEAPTAGSVILAGLLLKTGAYGMIRFLVPIFPAAAHHFAPVAMVLGVIGILYGAVQAFGQTDAKRLVAYTSVSHLGFVLLGIFAWNTIALEGAIMQMVAHGLSTGALFAIVGALQERLKTRDMRRMGGLWTAMPRFGSVSLFFVMASLGLPGLANFIGEYLVLLGTYQVSVPLTCVAVVGLVLGTVYSLAFMQRIFFGEKREDWKPADLRAHEVVVLASMILLVLWLGLVPTQVLGTAAPAVTALHHAAAGLGAGKLGAVGPVGAAGPPGVVNLWQALAGPMGGGAP